MAPSKRDKKGAVSIQQEPKLTAVLEVPLEVTLSPSDIFTKFPLFCAEEEACVIPEVMVFLDEPLCTTSAHTLKRSSVDSMKVSPSCERLVPAVQVVFEVPDQHQNPLQIFFKGFKVDNGLSRAIGRCLYEYNTITILKLENCRLRDNELTVIVNFMEENKSVKDLNMDMNPIREQSYFYILQKDTRLHHLSLRQCHINDYGVNLLSQELSYKDEDGSHQTLLSINLTHNHITCQGLQHLANALRTNRTLSMLSLAGNRIADEGAVALAEVLQKFALTHDEVVMRRHRNMARLTRRNALAEQKLQQVKQLIGATPKSEYLRGPSPNRKKESRSGSVRDKKKVAPVQIPSSNEQRRLELLAAQELEHDPHPYMSEVTQESGDIWCPGNMRLAHINLGYNQVGMMGVNALLQAAQWQETAVSTPLRGMVYIVLQGNPISEKCFELQELAELITSRTARMTEGSSTMVRESSSVTDTHKTSSRQFPGGTSVETRKKVLK